VIIARSPLRISIGGGGTDLPSYSDNFEGFLVASTIDKYVYVSIAEPFNEGIILKYSESEHVQNVNSIKHALIKESIQATIPDLSKIEIHSFADVPSGTGLGSSGSFTTALLAGLYRYKGEIRTLVEIANLACDIEINRLGHPSGKQDQFVSVNEGLNSFEFLRTGEVRVQKINVEPDVLNFLDSNLQLFFTGNSRDSETILADQKSRTLGGDSKIILGLHEAKEIGIATKVALERGDLDAFGELLSEQWEIKKRRSNKASSSEIDNLYHLGIKSGALGGKLIGAGGGGFLLFLSAEKEKTSQVMATAGARELPFSLSSQSCQVLVEK
jgi:D-glycero-alpha-D-manno-heptose-7-phosphate kinase